MYNETKGGNTMWNIITLATTQWYFGIWLGVFILALIIEASDPQLISIWFAGGALIAFILSLFPSVGIWTQVIVFTLSSGILLILSFIFFRKSFLNSKKISTNVDALVDEEVILLTDANKDNLGEVDYRDVRWKVTPKDPADQFKKGETVVIDSIRGNRLVIKKKGAQ